VGDRAHAPAHSGRTDDTTSVTTVAAPSQVPDVITGASAIVPMNFADVAVNAEAKAAPSITSGLDGFARDKATLLPEHLASLDQAAWGIHFQLSMLAHGGTVRVRVIGHTDTTASEAHNLALGTQRAASVEVALREALTKNGVTEAQLTAITLDSAGEADLAVPTGDRVNEPRNRRVHLEVTITPTEAPKVVKPLDLRLRPDFLDEPSPLRRGPVPPSAAQSDRNWLENALREDQLLRKLPDWAREKAIGALKDADETVAEKIVGAMPWPSDVKKAATAALKSILQLAKGKRYTPPPEPPRGMDLGPVSSFPKAPGEKIFQLFQKKF
jgi:outer membrane protein OmpA-like peptidoglycan-associated protein